MTSKNEKEEKVQAAPAADASPFDRARSANLRDAADQAANGGERAERKAAPYQYAYHPDGTDKRMVICRPDGSGEREITVNEWDKLQSNPNLPVGSWMVKFTEAIASHHSDDY